MKSEQTSRLQAILEFWHRIEFFIPFDLSAHAEEQEDRASFWLHADNLQDDLTQARRPIIPKDKEIASIRMYFGVFDKSEIVESVRRFCQVVDEASVYEDDERADLEGDTCFASLDLDAFGVPNFTRFSVSTLPWALGSIKNGGLSRLSSTAFETSRLRLKELLWNFAEQRRLSQPDERQEPQEPQPLSAADILDLHTILQDWAGFRTKPERPIALVKIRFKEQREQPVIKQLQAPKVIDLTPEGDDEPEDEDYEAAVDCEIGILNSFYLEDLEWAIALVRDSAIPEPLLQYLTPLGLDARVDLYSSDGRRAILQALNPRSLNRGRWPSAPQHAMSLMQQFAINMVGGLSDQGELFSVNGPPGTGKTTLLRDVIADNLVKRARALSGLLSPRDAFGGRSRKITFADGKTASVSPLRPELTGFEMVIASSNNTAVENISRDLPKRGSLWRHSPAEYLQSVAHNVAAQTEKGSFAQLKEEDQPWGLIASVLGNAKNRWAFTRRFSKPIGKEKKSTVQRGENLFQNIWGWLNNYQGPSFSKAAETFRIADAAVGATLTQYVRYADLFAEVGLSSCEEYCRTALSEREQAVRVWETAKLSHETGLNKAQTVNVQLFELKEEERLLDRSTPAWWYMLLPTATGRRHRQAKETNARAQLALNSRLQELKRSVKSLRSDVDAALACLERCEVDLKARQNAWVCKTEDFAKLGISLGHPVVPQSLDDLESDQFQIAGLWHSEKLASERSDLFAAALQLHAAWLAEVGQNKGGFGGNIFAAVEMLSGNIPIEPDAVWLIWQSFFMIVPVASTTFASFARQFQGVGVGEIGWLFIDEAGQAVPQAAVGALTRARRAVVIGDPLQIEPVFTLPTALIKALADLSIHTADGFYSPTQTSVQILADAANTFGTLVPTEGDVPLWIGSPLRVHRRCIDPMFSLANRIAYHEKMVFAAGDRSPSEDSPPFYGGSAWIDIKGAVSGKQTVPEQVAFVIQVVGESFRRDGDLPDLYVISPFKETKAALKRSFEHVAWTGPDGLPVPRPRKLTAWLKNRVGTVHTFQGKEENAVIMVLGTDASRRGAAKWAASAPNLLNVAVTRARHRIFMVGDRDLWREQPYFSEAASMMPSVQAAEFLARFRP